MLYLAVAPSANSKIYPIVSVDEVKENIKKKFQDHKLVLVDEVLELDAKNREAKLNGDDLRSKRIILTPYGKKINKEIEKNIIEFEKVLQNNIKEDDLRVFFKVTKQIQNNLKGENDD